MTPKINPLTHGIYRGVMSVSDMTDMGFDMTDMRPDMTDMRPNMADMS